MKKTLTLILGLALVAGLSLTKSCEGPEGPAGPAGADGTDEACKECHNDNKRDSVILQYASSVHQEGLNIRYAGARNDCAKCHSHEGFVETQHTGLDTTAANIPIPTAFSCNTCHDKHFTLDFENDGPDYAMRTNDPVTLMIDGTVQLDFEGSSNLCANCHQPRRPAPSSDDGNFTITSSHYGPHHGTQATMLEGIGGYETAGSEAYPEVGGSSHRTGSSCNSCHMPAAGNDNTSGGHSFVPNMASCTSCHTDADDFDINGFQSEVGTLIASLESKLVNNGIIDTEGDLLIPDGGLTLPVDQAGAYYNYATVVDDGSGGVHNPKYTKALLQNSIEAFN
jgi:hypothetical protein